ncbi:MAG: AraC family ligand binding domain-containing protein, partial [Victivallaceae bacterium]|nr:AraC family ligand binding domain-containing protein [Victivallaceae bacterium]
MTPDKKLHVCNGGRFVSRGIGAHPSRMIDSCELILVGEGRLSMFEGEQEFHLAEGDFLILRPGVRHGGLGTYPKDLWFYWVHFFTEDPNSLPVSGHLVNADKSRTLFGLLLNNQSDRGAPEGSGELLLALLLAECRRAAAVMVRLPEPAAVTEAKRLARMEFALPATSAGSIAAKLCLNRDYLNRL